MERQAIMGTDVLHEQTFPCKSRIGFVFDHVTIRASDRAATERFFDTVLPVVGLEKGYSDEWYAEWGDFSLGAAENERAVTRRLHAAFAAASHADVDAFHSAGVEAGYRSDGEPGQRPEYGPDYYGGFLLDPDGNSIEAVVHDSASAPGIDHLWIRVADLGASRDFYELVARHAGFRVEDRPGRVRFAKDDGTFSVLEGEPTTGLHIAFPAATNEAVDAFHADLTGAGHPDNGPPGERPVYHAGYYGAFVLDPDGTNVELVNHNR
jgi:catechol 2,3-dioxygenase-like lactoylglutathione lyase family enzyme